MFYLRIRCSYLSGILDVTCEAAQGLPVQSGDVMEFSPPPRSCQVHKWPDFNGYGFTLHNNKELGVQSIGRSGSHPPQHMYRADIAGGVDEKSPAAAAGLKKGDIIIEINGANVTRENHSQIVARIKASGDSTLFLVADKECKVRRTPHRQLLSESLRITTTEKALSSPAHCPMSSI